MFDSVKFRRLREDRSLSQREFAREMGVSQSFVSKLESGRVTPSLNSLRVLAGALGVPLSELLTPQASPFASGFPGPVGRDRVSAFISYGGPDEPFARALYQALERRGVDCFFFPEHATPGQALHRTMSEGVNNYDRVLLVCSRASLDRHGVLNEIEQVLMREAREGGAELLIPIAIDDFVFADWSPDRPDVARQVRGRVVADFRGAGPGSRAFEARVDRILRALTPG